MANNRKSEKEKSSKTVKTKTKKIEKTEVIVKNNVPKKSVVKASFLERLSAFIIDFILISFAASLITYPFSNSSNYQKLSTEATKTMEKYTKGKISAKTYMNRSADISYDMSKENGLSTIITIFVYALYFIVYQFKMSGQTIGKRLLKIKISRSDEKELSINDVMFRSLLVNFIMFDILILCITLFGNKNIYFYGTGILEFIQYGIIFVSAIMILSRKDKMALHDLITHTQVVKTNELVEEVEVCES